MQGFKYRVVKGDTTVALTTLLKEAKAEAKRVGGHYEPLTLAKNPVDPDYTKQLGRGAFSGAYKREFDPGVRGVQSNTKLEHAGGSLDVAKIILVEARKALRGNRKALAYLPNIRPVRVDYSDPNRPELIYTQPLLRGAWQDYRPSRNDYPWFYEIAAAIDRDNTGTSTLARSAEIASNTLKKASNKQARDEAKAVQEALLAVHHTAEKYAGPYKMHRYWSDMHKGNYGMDRKDKHIVIFDPFVYTMSIDNALKLWKDLGYPGAAPKVVKPKAAPKGPKTAKAPRQKGKGAFPKKVPVTVAPNEIKAKFRNKKDVLLFIVGYAEGGKLWPDMTIEMADTFGNVASDRVFFASHKAPNWLKQRVGEVSFNLLGLNVMTKDAKGAYTLKVKPAKLRDIMLDAKRTYPSR
jgi:hypothetical protein